MNILSPEQMMNCDKQSIKDSHKKSLELMKRAATGVYHVIDKLNVPKGNILILASSSQNGGDGFALAQILYDEGYEPAVIFTGKEEHMKPEALQYYAMCKEKKVPVLSYTAIDESVSKLLKQADIIVDAIVGINLKGELRENLTELVNEANLTDSVKIAIDIPTGLSALSGQALPTAFKADYTVAVQALKYGHLLADASQYCGKVVVHDIGVPTPDEICDTVFLQKEEVLSVFPERKDNAHKYYYGNILIAGGSEGMSGAPLLAARAALRCGSGLVSIGTDSSVYGQIACKAPEELMVQEIDSTQTLIEQLPKKDTVVVGCGLGRLAEKEQWLRALLMSSVQLIIDADGLYFMDKLFDTVREKKAKLLMSPHTKEAQRLLPGSTVEEILNDPVGSAKEISNLYDSEVILKTNRNIVALTSGEVYISPKGNNGMATAGSGDVLAGLAGGLAGQCKNLRHAAVCAAYLHGVCGDLAKEKYGTYSLNASDIIEMIPQGIKEILA